MERRGQSANALRALFILLQDAAFTVYRVSHRCLAEQDRRSRSLRWSLSITGRVCSLLGRCCFALTRGQTIKTRAFILYRWLSPVFVFLLSKVEPLRDCIAILLRPASKETKRCDSRPRSFLISPVSLSLSAFFIQSSPLACNQGR